METRRRYKRLSGPTQTLLRTEGESGRFEFKRTAQAANQRVLVAAANAAALEGIKSVTILVGVGEKADETTGAVSGEVLGLPDVEKATERITNYGGDTKPVPVGLRIIQENLNTKKPILRLVVWPTRPPHYTQDGRRVTRYGASTRAITDEELVEMYLLREARSFQARFRETADELISELAEIRGLTELHRRELEATGERLVKVHELSDQAAAAAEESFYFAEGIADDLGRVEGKIEDLANTPPNAEELFHRLRVVRSQALFYVDLIKDKKLRAEVSGILEPILQREPRVYDYRRNLREMAEWGKFGEAGPHRPDADPDEVRRAAEGVAASHQPPDPETLRQELEDAYPEWATSQRG